MKFNEENLQEFRAQWQEEDAERFPFREEFEKLQKQVNELTEEVEDNLESAKKNK